jgi:hypothetical protein
MKKIALGAAGLLLMAPGAFAGEFFSGTRSESSRFDNARVSTGHETVNSYRHFSNKMQGSSHKHFVNVSASAENARLGNRHYGFIEGDSEFNADLATTGNGVVGGLGGSFWGGGGGAIGNLGAIAGNASLGSEIDGMAGTGSEMYLDGSLNANAEWGGARSTFQLSEGGNTTYNASIDFAETSTTDGTKASGGSVYSFN